MAANPEVDAFIAELDHPLEDVMRAVRAAMLEDPRVSETLKWKSPTFMYEGNLASINPRAKAHVSLMFHEGAKIPGVEDGDFPHLEGGGKTARYMRFPDLNSVAQLHEELAGVITAWCALKDG